MELRHLRYFVALAEYLSFTRAAQRVHVTQSTLSHQIRQLEEELGQTLFDRIGRKVVTTEAGELFLGFATRALQEVDHGIATLKPSSRGLTGQVRIGTTHTFNIGLIPECVALFLTRHPGVQVRVEELPADQIGERLQARELDIGLIAIELSVILLMLLGFATTTRSQHEALGLLTDGPYGSAFWVLVVGFGLAVPLVLEQLQVRRRILDTPVPSLMVLIGGLALRAVIVFAGQASSVPNT